MFKTIELRMVSIFQACSPISFRTHLFVGGRSLANYMSFDLLDEGLNNKSVSLICNLRLL